MLLELMLLIACQFRVFDNKPIVKPEPKGRDVEIVFTTQNQQGDGRQIITAYSGKNCKYCKQAYDLVGEGDDRFIIDWTEDELPLHIKRRLGPGYNFPVFVAELEDGSVIWPKFWALYDKDTLYRALSRPTATKNVTYAASGVGGVIHGKAQIQKSFKWIEKNIGDDVVISLDLKRTGAQTFPFKQGTDWSYKAFLGGMGEANLKINGAKNLMFSELSTSYKTFSDRDDLDLNTKIVIKNFGKNLTSSQIEKLDPITISIIFQTLNFLYQVINPKIDLQVPGDLSADIAFKGDKVDVEFKKMPYIHVSAWWNFNLGVKNISLTDSEAVLNFTGSRWIKSRKLTIVD